MAKGKKSKKKNLKLRRQLRKTLGCLFMISALIVTAIPVTPMEAADEEVAEGWITDIDNGKYYIRSNSTTIPHMDQPNTPVYQDGTANFRFVFVDENGNWDPKDSQPDKFAVIVGYNRNQTLPQGGVLRIPTQMDAYVKVTDTQSIYAAANRDGKPLYYIKTKKVTTQVPGDPVLVGTNPDGTPKYETSMVDVTTDEFDRYAPCTVADKDTWSPDGNDLQLYYFNSDVPPENDDLTDENVAGWVPITYETARITNAEVKYIGNQYAEYRDNKWQLAATDSDANHSVFGGSTVSGGGGGDSDVTQGAGMAAGNITQLTIGSNLIGIGKYAFNNCVNIQDVQLGNGLNSLEDYAFANCGNLGTVGMDYNTNLPVLGAYAFSNCEQLQEFEIPTALQAIGDFCFQNCTNLKSIKMTDPNRTYNLTAIGYKAFVNCSSLEKLDLPSKYHGGDLNGQDVFHLSTVRGCISLKSITTPSQRLRFVSDAADKDFPQGGNNDGSYSDASGTVDGGYTFELFKADVGDEFYFEAPGYLDGTGNRTKTPVHNIANVRHICFKHYGEDRYEIVESGICRDSAEPEVGLAYEVNSAGELNGFRIEDAKTGVVRGNVLVPDIEVPAKIGPHTVRAITTNPNPNITSFADNCGVEKIALPNTIESIGSGAFKGCHHLQHIIFMDGGAAKITSLGDNAFATQKVNSNHTCGEDIAGQVPFLSFTGDIVNAETGQNTEPFKYAMKSTSKINEGTQPLSYITYYSGWPTNLAVQYNPDTQMSELQYFPTMDDAKNGFQVEDDYVGGYIPADTPSAGPYRFPYMTRDMEIEIEETFGSDGSVSLDTENKRDLVGGIENIVIPVGVNSIKKGLFSGLNENGYFVDDPTNYPPLSASGNVPSEERKTPGRDVKTLTVQSVAQIEPYTFARMSSLTNAYVNGAQSIGNYAFDRCENLQTAQVSADTTELGLRPFSGCKNLADLQFPDNAYFAVDNGIIYGIDQDENKTKKKIIECLESRGSVVGSIMAGPNEFDTITEIADEAFMDCDMIASIDLSTSTITRVPEKCFAEMDKLTMVTLPGTARSIGRGSFWNTPGLAQVKIPYSAIQISPDAFAEVPVEEEVWKYGDPQDRTSGRVALVVNPNSAAVDYVLDYPYLELNFDDSLKGLFSVALRDGLTEKVYDIKHVPEGDNLELTILDIPDHTEEGYQFERWSPDPESINPITKDNLEVTAMYLPIGATTYTVRFFDIEGKEMEEYTQQVEEGKSAKSPAKSEMEVDGKVFTGWDRDFSEITGPLDVHPIYIDRVAGKYYVTFYTDMDLATMIGRVQEVNEGESAIEPAHPTKEGYTFLRWSSDGWQNVTRDWEIFAVYTEGSGGTDIPAGPFNVSFYTDSDLATRIGEVQVVAGGESAVEPEHPTKEGFTFSGWSTDEWRSVTRNLDVYAVYTNNNGGNGNNGGGDGDDGDDGDDNNNSTSNNSVSNNGVKYKVTVNGGSGSGEYTAGTIVPINAYARADGTVFDKWTSSSNGVGFVNQTAISTTFTMPSNDVTIEANFKTGSGSSSSSVSGNSRNANRNSTTTVDVSKGGISNTDLASANVNGSSDNFVIRITDDASATAAVIAALEAKYGDISDIAYLPMDISLYDAAGTTKITDVSGITVDITLPLPDDLIQYAGNNRAASVVNGRLEDLNTSFTTIDGVPCVQFTATHFSPYTIYVDTAHLSAGTIDATPKTGDPIHPKWFLAMGLACISIVLFCKKDKQPKLKRA